MKNIVQQIGSDIPLTITLPNVIIDNQDNIIVYVVEVEKKVVLSKFSITTAEGYNKITVADSDDGIIDIVIPDAENNTPGKYRVEYKLIDTTTNTDVYPDGFDEYIEVCDAILVIEDNKISSDTWV